MNIVLIPCFDRPEFLQVCLEHIKNADGWKDNHYHFALDYGFDPEIPKIIEDHIPSSKWSSASRGEREYKYNNYNILEGYRESHELSNLKSDLIFNIEPDIFISKGFFEFHIEAHKLQDAFMVSACKNQNWNRKIPRFIDRVYPHSSFQSLGISFKPEIVDKFLIHADHDFYQDPKTYLDVTHFPDSPIKGMHYDQDGLIHRVQQQSGLPSLYPCNPMAYHAGFYGLNREGIRIPGKAKDQADMIREMGEDEMNARAKVYKDIHQCNLDQICVKPLGVLDLPDDLPIETAPPQTAGYSDKWLKRGIKVRSK